MILKLNRDILKALIAQMQEDDLIIIDTAKDNEEIQLERVISTSISIKEISKKDYSKASQLKPFSRPTFNIDEQIALNKAQSIIDSEDYYKTRPLLSCTRGKKIHTLIGTSINTGKDCDDYLVSVFDNAVKEGLLTND